MATWAQGGQRGWPPKDLGIYLVDHELREGFPAAVTAVVNPPTAPDPARLIPPPPLHRLPLPGWVGTHHRVIVAVRIGIVVLLVPLVVLLLLQSRGFCL